MSNGTWKHYEKTVPSPDKIRGTSMNAVFSGVATGGKTLYWEREPFVPNGTDPNRYHRLRQMRVNRQSSWATGCVDVSLTHLPSNITSRSVALSAFDSTQEAVMAMVIDALARELETEIAVYERLEKAK